MNIPILPESSFLKRKREYDAKENVPFKYRKVEIEAEPLPPPHHINRSYSAEDLRIDPMRTYNWDVLKKV